MVLQIYLIFNKSHLIFWRAFDFEVLTCILLNSAEGILNSQDPKVPSYVLSSFNVDPLSNIYFNICTFVLSRWVDLTQYRKRKFPDIFLNWCSNRQNWVQPMKKARCEENERFSDVFLDNFILWFITVNTYFSHLNTNYLYETEQGLSTTKTRSDLKLENSYFFLSWK